MITDRRAAARIPRRLKVMVGADVGFTADVTANGFCVETAHVVQPGTCLSGTISLDGHDFAFTGMVCWARGGQHGRMGVRFIEVPREFELEFRDSEAKP